MQIVALPQVTNIIHVIFKYLSLVVIEEIQKETWGESERCMTCNKSRQLESNRGKHHDHEATGCSIEIILAHHNHHNRRYKRYQQPQKKNPEYLRSVSCVHLTCSQENSSYESRCLVKDTVWNYWKQKYHAKTNIRSVLTVSGLNDNIITFLNYIFSICLAPWGPRCEHPSQRMPLFFCISFSCVVHRTIAALHVPV